MRPETQGIPYCYTKDTWWRTFIQSNFDQAGLKVTQRSIVVLWVKIFKTEFFLEIQLVRLNEVCGKLLSEKNA